MINIKSAENQYEIITKLLKVQLLIIVSFANVVPMDGQIQDLKSYRKGD